jgi:hypothetical protein
MLRSRILRVALDACYSTFILLIAILVPKGRHCLVGLLYLETESPSIVFPAMNPCTFCIDLRNLARPTLGHPAAKFVSINTSPRGPLNRAATLLSVVRG